jgi:trigger factor
MADDVAADDDGSNDESVGTEEKTRIDMSVDIVDAGPCKKHVRVSIPDAEVQKFLNREFTDLVRNAAVPGFRPGKAPRRLIERRFKEDVADKVKSSILFQSLEQIGEEQKLDPLSEPAIDPRSINLPETGDFVYEFDVEVRPEFALPEYKSLSIKRPTKTFTDKDVDAALETFRRRQGDLQTKAGGAELGDYVVVDIRFNSNGEIVREFEEITVRVDKELTFRDGAIVGFFDGIKGAKEGDTRELKVKMADSVSRTELAGQEIDAVFVVKEVKEIHLPALDSPFFDKIGVADEGELRDFIRTSLERRLDYARRREATQQVLSQVTGKTDIQLPQDLLKRQTERALARRLIELENAGYGEEEIRSRINRLRQDSIASTAQSLKEQFVLQAIAEAEEIKVDEEDLETEVINIAMRSGESARRVRSRIEKDNLWDAIGMQVLERKTVDKVIEYATIEEVPWTDDELASSGIDESAVPEVESVPATDETSEETG